MCKCAVPGCEREVVGKLTVGDRSYPLCAFHGEVLEDRILSVTWDEEELQGRLSNEYVERNGSG